MKQLTLFCLALTLILAAPLRAADKPGESAVEQMAKRGSLRAGTDIFVPWAMKDKNGELIGFEVDVARKIAEDAGLKLELVTTEWSGIIPALTTGKFDAIFGMTATPERNLKINFSDPYYFTSLGLLANKKMTEGMKIEDFNSPEVTIAVRMGSTPAVYAKKAFPKAQLKLFDNEPAAVQEVRGGRAHAMISGQPLPAQQALAAPDLLVAYPDQLNQEPVALGLRKGDVDTLNFFNNWIARERASGWIQERYHYWFETMDWQELVQ